MRRLTNSVTSAISASPASSAVPKHLPHPEEGAGLLELVLATALFLTAAVVIGPLFSVAERSALEGRSRARASRFAAEHLELWTPGEEVEAEVKVEYLWPESGEWRPEPPPAGSSWVRETQVNVLAMEALDDGRVDLHETLDEGAPPQPLALVRVEVRMRRGSAAHPVASLSRLEWTGAPR